MKSDRAKVLHEVLGRPMAARVLETLREAGIEDLVVVVGHQAERVEEALRPYGARFVRQEPQLGTGHAVLQTERLLAGRGGTLLVLAGDTPLLTAATLRAFLEFHAAGRAAATVLSARVSDPSGYGRVIRSPDGSLDRIVEERDATEAEKAVREINSGLFCFEEEQLFPALKGLDNHNDQGEYYLPVVVSILREAGHPVAVYRLDDDAEVHGINTLQELHRAEEVLRSREEA
jgi:UDP-N-acetylglucosamine diphosphorylase/glucosamine-1-phosphate N-acetyltransferase